MSATPVPRPCPVCGAGEAADYLQKGELRLVLCRRCGMVFANPVPDEFASGKYYNQLGTDYYLSPAKLESDFADVRFERELRLFRKHCPRGAVLDVGCSTGAFLYQLNRRFPGDYDLVGNDASGPALDYAAARGVAVVRGAFPEEDFAGRAFDAVTFWAVLEHLYDPKAFVERAGAVLKPQGLCFVLVPNMQSLAARLLGRRYRYVYAQHLNYFTRRTLVTLVQARFSVLASVSTHFNPVVVWQDWRRGGKEVPDNQRAELLKRTTAYKQSPWLKPVSGLYHFTERALGCLNLADNLVLVLRKK
jgi:2-polyprenyl-3-methyl-5-hydroxy-6-metoxy-1,4-benzoquinol methylase